MIAQVDIHAALRNGITFLKGSYFSPPFKLSNISEDRNAQELQLMLMCSSPGVLDDDEYKIKVELDERCHVELFTQSYQRLFSMRRGATQCIEVHLKDQAAFTYLPHPTVPHKDSIFIAQNRIYLSGGCRLLWGEVITCGRKLRGEVFEYSKIQNTTEVFVNNRLILKENLRLTPASQNLKAMGQLEGFTHQASLIYLNGNSFDEKLGREELRIEEMRRVDQLKESVHKILAHQAEITYGISTPQAYGLVVRILGRKGEQLHDCLKKVAACVKELDAPHAQSRLTINDQLTTPVHAS